MYITLFILFLRFFLLHFDEFWLIFNLLIFCIKNIYQYIFDISIKFKYRYIYDYLYFHLSLLLLKIQPENWENLDSILQLVRFQQEADFLDSNESRPVYGINAFQLHIIFTPIICRICCQAHACKMCSSDWKLLNNNIILTILLVDFQSGTCHHWWCFII